jgi:DNA-binding GntR family transcriptional regulator
MNNAMDELEKTLLEMEPIDLSDSRLLHNLAYDRIKTAIKQSSLSPGDLLSESRISKALGISRTPVREAIRRLAQDGLIQIIPGRAIVMASPSIQDVEDALHVRELLEPELVRLAVGSLPQDALNLLVETTSQMKQAAKSGDRKTWSKADTVWHEILSDHCPNQMLGKLVLQARNRVIGIIFQDHYNVSYLLKGTDEHKAIVDAILVNDSEAAETRMREHLTEARKSIFQQYY